MPGTPLLRLLVAVLTALPVLVVAPAASAAVTAGESTAGAYTAGASTVTAAAAEEWVGTWSGAPQRPYDEGRSADGFRDQTLRMTVHTSIGGPQVRVRLSNRFGDRTVRFQDVHVGIRASGSALVEGTNRPVTFRGSTRVDAAAGREVVSDPMALMVGADQDIAVSVYLPTATGPATWHRLPRSTNYMAPGNRTTRTDGSGFPDRTRSWFFVSGVDVLAAAAAGAVVALGDSITDGHSSTVGAERTWPDALADRLKVRGGRPLGVLNQGISGNRLLTSRPCCGQSALRRLERDVLTRPGVETVILLEGVNDIMLGTADGPVTVAQITEGYEEVIRRAHERGLRVVGATLTPFGGHSRSTFGAERKRQAVNAWIRTSGAFDAVVDADAAVRDSDDPRQLRPSYDSGDHLHPSDAGYAAIAAAVDLGVLLAPVTLSQQALPRAA